MRTAWANVAVVAFLGLATGCGSDDSGGANGGAGNGGTSSGGSGASGGATTGGTGGTGAGTSGGGSGGASGSSGDGGSGGSGGTAGVGNSGGAGGGGGKTYSTNFDGTENPISEGDVWTNGGTDGLDWQDVEKAGGIAYGTGVSAGYNDCLAHLSGFSANQFAEATLHVQSGYTPPDSHEVELLLRFQITAHSARGYEINNGWNGAYSQIVRWNGALNDFTYLATTGPGFGALVEGDVIRATAIGDTITVYKNGAEVMTVKDSTWSDGDPGMAMFIRPGATAVPENYAFTSFTAGEL